MRGAERAPETDKSNHGIYKLHFTKAHGWKGGIGRKRVFLLFETLIGVMGKLGGENSDEIIVRADRSEGDGLGVKEKDLKLSITIGVGNVSVFPLVVLELGVHKNISSSDEVVHILLTSE